MSLIARLLGKRLGANRVVYAANRWCGYDQRECTVKFANGRVSRKVHWWPDPDYPDARGHDKCSLCPTTEAAEREQEKPRS